MITSLIRRGFILLILSAAMASASDLTITRVQSGWRDAASFKRISEYFTGRENTSGITVLRTQPEQRAGYYFLIRTANPGTPVNAQCLVTLITPVGHQLLTHTFTAELKTGDTVLNLGLTGTDWSDPKANPVAWKIEISAGGQLLASEKSYLWNKPVGE